MMQFIMQDTRVTSPVNIAYTSLLRILSNFGQGVTQFFVSLYMLVHDELSVLTGDARSVGSDQKLLTNVGTTDLWRSIFNQLLLHMTITVGFRYGVVPLNSFVCRKILDSRDSLDDVCPRLDEVLSYVHFVVCAVPSVVICRIYSMKVSTKMFESLDRKLNKSPTEQLTEQDETLNELTGETGNQEAVVDQPWELADRLLSVATQSSFLAALIVANLFSHFTILISVLYNFFMAILYSSYGFEYAWVHRKDSFNTRCTQLQRRWAYFAGFGMPMTLLLAWASSSFLLTGLTFATAFPIFVAASTYASKHDSSELTQATVSPFVLPCLLPSMLLSSTVLSSSTIHRILALAHSQDGAEVLLASRAQRYTDTERYLPTFISASSDFSMPSDRAAVSTDWLAQVDEDGTAFAGRQRHIAVNDSRGDGTDDFELLDPLAHDGEVSWTNQDKIEGLRDGSIGRKN